MEEDEWQTDGVAGLAVAESGVEDGEAGTAELLRFLRGGFRG